ncbi:hypothetical protein [Parvularcula dongshanensis]|uniref:Sel1 repeat family protein n=1 Tax=Parvularcula dongshanensis TaxID=1173995 RepID=A0A840I789_9PROT|nr:hypothetical protein [Parvularcula dongshanensis]MBB4659840.1 hypothetical protein [Parvularcula dongshanensis]
MSVSLDHTVLAEAEKMVLTSEEMYRRGLEASTPLEGASPCLVTAHKWFNLAALEGNDQARVYRQQLTLEMNHREVAEAQRQAREWVRSRKAVLATV